MIQLGKTQTLEMIKATDFGIYLGEKSNAKSDETVLLPKSQVPADTKVGDSVTVFIYKDSEDRPIATTLTHKVQLHELALLSVKEATTIGAFLDWGIAKDLMLPFKEQTKELTAGEKVLVYLYIDKSKRLCATMKIYERLSKQSPYKKDDKVTGIVYEIIPAFGAFIAVDYQYSAMIPNQDLFQPLQPGDIVTARVTNVLADGKLNLSIREKTFIQLDKDAEEGMIGQ